MMIVMVPPPLNLNRILVMVAMLLLTTSNPALVRVDAFAVTVQELMKPLASIPLDVSHISLEVIGITASPLDAHWQLQTEAIHHLGSAATTTTSTTSTTIASASSPVADITSNLNPLSLYMNTLKSNPLATKMMTGATLAFTGDWIAQSRVPEEPYDKRRAASFAMFDSAYRATQHVLYPMVVATCQGQFLTQLLPVVDTNTAAAMEQTLVSQCIIVPLLYYPVFYGVTSFVQGLTWEGTVERAQQTFIPLMKRNLLFWIPVQFVQFSFLPEDLQIPFLSICGLCWTLILSVMAGSAKQYNNNGNNSNNTETEAEPTTSSPMEEDQHQEPYCVTGIEEECVIGEDGLFPHTGAIEGITEEMKEMANEVTQEWERRVAGKPESSSSSTSSKKNREEAEAEAEQEEELLMRK